MQILVGLESTKLQNKENSVEFPMLARELHAKIKAAGIAVDHVKFELMYQPARSEKVE
jgi:hypothetical protein